MGATLTQTNHNEQTLTALFPAMDAVTIQQTLDTTKGDTAKAIVLLIQTPPSSPGSIPPTNTVYEQHTDSNEKAFIKAKMKSNQCHRFYYVLSIAFWIFAAMLFVVSTILSATEFIVDPSFTITMCLCSVMELLFTLLILYGVISHKIWCIWVTLIWTALHGMTTIYLLVKWHNDSLFIWYYIALVLFYWFCVFIFNIMYFIKLNAAESMFNSIIAETKDAVIKERVKVPINNNSNTPTLVTASTNNTAETAEFDSNPSLNSEDTYSCTGSDKSHL